MPDAVLRSAERVWQDLRFRDLYRSGKDFELMGRAMGFAALALLTVFPLLVVVAAASAATHRGVAVWVVYGMGLTGSSARAVSQLFSAPARVLSTTSAFSLLLLAVFGMTFAGSVQGGFERIWGLPAGPWHKYWRQAVWLVIFLAYIYAAATVGSVVPHRGPAETIARVSVAVVLGLVFFWWGLRFLVGGRVPYLAAMPGAVITVAFLAGLRAFSALVFQPLIVTNAVTYGDLGTVLIVQSWLIGVGWVVYGGQLFGRWFHEAWLQAWADNRPGSGKPGPGKRGSGKPGAEREEPVSEGSKPASRGPRLQPMVHVEDMAAAVAFYEALGGVVRQGSRDGDWVLMDIGGGEISLLAHPPNPEQREGRVELNFQAAGPLDELERALRQAGVVVIRPASDEGFGRQLQVASPDGLLVKINELNPELYT
jgi:membrane protein